MDVRTATPVEIDTELARIGGEMARQYQVIDRAQRIIDMEYKHPAPDGSVNQRRIDQCQQLTDTAGVELARLMIERSPLEAEFGRRGGWTRYFLVDSETGNGHVHFDDSTRRCSRVPATRHYWLVDQSGRPAVEVVADAGERACTVCFSWAPVETLMRPTMFYTPAEQEKQAARAERARKAEVKRAKLITTPEGDPLMIGGRYGERITSVVGAERAVVDIRVWAKVCRRDLTAAEFSDIERVLKALAAERGTDVETERAALEDKYVAKCKREGVTP